MLSTFSGSTRNFGAHTERIERVYVNDEVPKTKKLLATALKKIEPVNDKFNDKKSECKSARGDEHHHGGSEVLLTTKTNLKNLIQACNNSKIYETRAAPVKNLSEM